MLKLGVLVHRFLTLRLFQHRALSGLMFLLKMRPAKKTHMFFRHSSWSSSPFSRQGLVLVHHCGSKTVSSTILVASYSSKGISFCRPGHKADHDILLFPSPHHVFSTRPLPWDLYAFRNTNSLPSVLSLDSAT